MAPKRRKTASKVVLVTGGSGLVGNGVQLALKKEGGVESSERIANCVTIEIKDEKWVFASSKTADLKSMEDTRRAFEAIEPTHVLHLAAHVGGLFANLSSNVEFFRWNMAMLDNVMECSRIYRVEKLMTLTSTCVFPDKTTYPLDETMMHNGPPHTSNEGYAMAKRMADTLSRCYKKQYGCNFSTLIPTNVYGPHDNFSISNGHVIPGLIHKCYLAKKNDTPFTVWGSGKPLRQFIYSEDLGRLMIWAVREYENAPEALILSVGEEDEVSIGDVARAIAEAMNFEGEVKFDTSKADGQFKKTASNERLMKAIKKFEFTPMPKGIKESCDWFVKNFESCRK